MGGTNAANVLGRRINVHLRNACARARQHHRFCGHVHYTHVHACIENAIRIYARAYKPWRRLVACRSTCHSRPLPLHPASHHPFWLSLSTSSIQNLSLSPLSRSNPIIRVLRLVPSNSVCLIASPPAAFATLAALYFPATLRSRLPVASRQCNFAVYVQTEQSGNCVCPRNSPYRANYAPWTRFLCLRKPLGFHKANGYYTAVSRKRLH